MTNLKDIINEIRKADMHLWNIGLEKFSDPELANALERTMINYPDLLSDPEKAWDELPITLKNFLTNTPERTDVQIRALNHIKSFNLSDVEFDKYMKDYDIIKEQIMELIALPEVEKIKFVNEVWSMLPDFGIGDNLSVDEKFSKICETMLLTPGILDTNEDVVLLIQKALEE